MNKKFVVAKSETVADDAPFVGLLLHNISFAWIWLSVRVLVGLTFLGMAGSHDIDHMNVRPLNAILNGVRTSATIPAPPQPSLQYDAPHNLLHELPHRAAQGTFVKLIALSEFSIGIGLLFGAFFGTATLFGMLLNWKIISLASLSLSAELLTASVLFLFIWNMTLYPLWHIISQRIAWMSSDMLEKRKGLPRLTIG